MPGMVAGQALTFCVSPHFHYYSTFSIPTEIALVFDDITKKNDFDGRSEFSSRAAKPMNGHAFSYHL